MQTIKQSTLQTKKQIKQATLQTKKQSNKQPYKQMQTIKQATLQTNTNNQTSNFTNKCLMFNVYFNTVLVSQEKWETTKFAGHLDIEDGRIKGDTSSLTFDPPH